MTLSDQEFLTALVDAGLELVGQSVSGYSVQAVMLRAGHGDPVPPRQWSLIVEYYHLVTETTGTVELTQFHEGQHCAEFPDRATLCAVFLNRLEKALGTLSADDIARLDAQLYDVDKPLGVAP